MEPKQEVLLYAVKKAVSQYGMEYISTRNIAAAAGVSDGNIYRFYKDRDMMLHDAFILEMKPLHNWLCNKISLPDEAWGNKYVKECCRELFDGYWWELMHDPLRTGFFVMYTQSQIFKKNSLKACREMFSETADSVRCQFPDYETAERVVYNVATIIYGFAWDCLSGAATDDERSRNALFETLYNMLCMNWVKGWKER